jgi:hypothetical protein
MRTALLVSVAVLVATAFYRIAQTEALFGALVCFTIQLLWMPALGVFKAGYICRKCKNTHVSLGNVLNYPENDRTVLDTPFEKTIRIFTENYDG